MYLKEVSAFAQFPGVLLDVADVTLACRGAASESPTRYALRAVRTYDRADKYSIR